MGSEAAKDNARAVPWDEITGGKNWEGLVEPELELSLREFIIRCGDLCQATYDAFNSVAESPNCGNSNYGKPNFFKDVMLKEASRYKVVSFLYATPGLGSDTDHNVMVHPRTPNPWDRESNWFGYVAVTTDEESRALGRREVYVAWRGTIMKEEWGSNVFGAMPVPATPLFSTTANAHKVNSGGFLWWGKKEPKVHGGWLNIYTSNNTASPYVKCSVRQQLHAAVQAIRKKYAGEKLSVIVTGHSLGGSLATLSAFDLAENDVAGGDDVRVTGVAFGCPQVGNVEFKERALSLPNLKILQVNNIRDMVPKTPDMMLNLYVPVANEELEIDTRKSPYLVWKTIGDCHNLQANLHVVAGWSSMGKPFELKVKRSLALVNKSANCLRGDLKIPAAWWGERNKGMEYDAAKDEWVFDPAPPASQMVGVSI